jgi:hypothetical protein
MLPKKVPTSANFLPVSESVSAYARHPVKFGYVPEHAHVICRIIRRINPDGNSIGRTAKRNQRIKLCAACNGNTVADETELPAVTCNVCAYFTFFY